MTSDGLQRFLEETSDAQTSEPGASASTLKEISDSQSVHSGNEQTWIWMREKEWLILPTDAVKGDGEHRAWFHDDHEWNTFSTQTALETIVEDTTERAFED